jgi:3-methyladenine DNA glycosylase AlkD
MTHHDVRARMTAIASPERAAASRRYFKTGPGEYGEGDVFVGLAVPQIRALAKEFAALPFSEARALLDSPVHEERLLALLVLVRQFARGDDETRRAIYELYLGSTARINNWDLVDSSAEHIVGRFIDGGDRSVLDRLARSSSLWERRIAILATMHFIKQGEFGETLRLAEMLLDDEEDLIHKGVGWMLREVGNRDRERLERFLRVHYRRMPRTMLRYAIEKFPEDDRKAYLRGER